MILPLVLWLSLAMVADAAGTRPLLVSAAASLTDSLEECARAFESAAGVKVTFNFAGSNTLARQIVNGAPVDVFISADDGQMDVIERAGMIVPGTRAVLVSNRLAVIVHRDADPRVTSFASLSDPAIRRIAIGDPAAVPAGVYARQYLEQIGLWAALSSKLVPVTNVRAALAAVEKGAADAAIVYVTDASVSRDVRIAATTHAGTPRILYPAGIVTSTRSEARARRFLEFLHGDVARGIFTRHGFLIPDRAR